jgi:glycosyltransferase involved in cell wall biosynthesis
LSEGFGLVIIEAMSCGTIPIATDLAVIHDIIQNNITGIFIDIKNPIDISQKIINYLSNKEKLVPMKVKAREFVVNNFDWEIVKKNYSKLLSSL